LQNNAIKTFGFFLSWWETASLVPAAEGSIDLSSASIDDAGNASRHNDVPPLVQDVGAVLRTARMVIVATIFVADFMRLRRAW
jgi:hypothetical protein